MDRESHLDNLRQQYSEEIHEAYVECAHEHGHVDFEKLGKLLTKLMKNAKVEGLPTQDFEELVRATLPEATGKVDLKAPLAA